MKPINILPLVAFSSAFIVPDQDVMSQIAIETHQTPNPVSDEVPTRNQVVKELESTIARVMQTSQNALDQAIEYARDTGRELSQRLGQTAFDAKSWLESEDINYDGHRGLPGHGHHGHHGHKPNLTVYQLIAKSEHTTKLASLINEFPDIVTLLNGTAANYTVFAPVNSAFEHIPKDASKEDIKNLLLYHVSSDFYPAGRVLVSHTIPSSYPEEDLGGQLQRLSLNIGLRGLTVNYYSRIIAVNIVSDLVHLTHFYSANK